MKLNQSSSGTMPPPTPFPLSPSLSSTSSAVPCAVQLLSLIPAACRTGTFLLQGLFFLVRRPTYSSDRPHKMLSLIISASISTGHCVRGPTTTVPSAFYIIFSTLASLFSYDQVVRHFGMKKSRLAQKETYRQSSQHRHRLQERFVHLTLLAGRLKNNPSEGCTVHGPQRTVAHGLKDRENVHHKTKREISSQIL